MNSGAPPEGFLGRWSRRKADARAGRPLEEPVAPEPPAAPADPVAPLGPLAPTTATAQPGTAPPPPSLQDTLALTPESDFRPFVARGVAPEVRNAALKKLFTDPRFNVMDGLDTYIDDYSRPDPLPAAQLRQLASARFLGLVDEPDAPQPPRQDLAAARDVADATAPAAVAQSEPTHDRPAVTPAAPPTLNDHAHADLRLQPDDAAPGRSPGGGAR